MKTYVGVAPWPLVEMRGQLHAPAAFPPGKDPPRVPTVQETGAEEYLLPLVGIEHRLSSL
jgi:hypothetical protein